MSLARSMIRAPRSSLEFPRSYARMSEAEQTGHSGGQTERGKQRPGMQSQQKRHAIGQGASGLLCSQKVPSSMPSWSRSTSSPGGSPTRSLSLKMRSEASSSCISSDAASRAFATAKRCAGSGFSVGSARKGTGRAPCGPVGAH